jgi:uncharacterized protein
MSERNDGFAPGVPFWVDTWQPDATAAADFYARLMGWEPKQTTTEGAGPQYVMCRLRGRDVAAIGSAGAAAVGGGAGAPPVPAPAGASAAWTTYIRVDSVDDAVATARDAGGAVIAPPFDSLEGGRIALLADPAGAVFGVWAPGNHGGAQLVNEAGAWAMSVLLCDEPDAVKPFYAALFGWTGDPFPFGDAEGTLFRRDGYVGGEPNQPVPRDVVAVLAPAFGRPAGWVAGFWVDSADDTAARAPELGGTVLAGPFDSGISRDAVIADPAGAVFSVTTAPTAAR